MKGASQHQLALPIGKKLRKRRRGPDGKLIPLGRRPQAERVGFMPHDARAVHDKNHPVHVTIRRVALGPSFRTQLICGAIRRVIAAAKSKGVRVLHYSVQENHLHLMVEAESAADLSNQMRTLFSRIAFTVNAVAQRRGRLFRDRHHRHALKTPREVRNALVYILFNDRKHRASDASVQNTAPTIDRCSSAYWMHDWSPSDKPPEGGVLPLEDAPTTKPKTWLASWGWHRGKPSLLLRFSECPRRCQYRGTPEERHPLGARSRRKGRVPTRSLASTRIDRVPPIRTT